MIWNIEELVIYIIKFFGDPNDWISFMLSQKSILNFAYRLYQINEFRIGHGSICYEPHNKSKYQNHSWYNIITNQKAIGDFNLNIYKTSGTNLPFVEYINGYEITINHRNKWARYSHFDDDEIENLEKQISSGTEPEYQKTVNKLIQLYKKMNDEQIIYMGSNIYNSKLLGI